MDRLSFDETLEELINKYVDLKFSRHELVYSLLSKLRDLEEEIEDGMM
jgi:hypothetical protein